MASRVALSLNTRMNCGLVCWHLDANPSGYMGASSHFRLTVRCHPLNWMPARRCRLLKAARFQNLRHIILNASAADLKEEFSSGTEREDKPHRRPDIDTVLVVAETFSITVAAAAFVASMTVHGSQESRLVVSSALQPFMPRKANLPLWQSFFLIVALIINAILRARQWQGKGDSRNLTVDVTMSVEERMQKMEEDTASVVTIIRVLSKQLEKLAVRFRVTRQTLREPIQETAVLAQKTSESVNILATREDALEKSLEEIHHVLLGMQENQTKQLELISTLGKLVKDGPRENLEKRIKAGRNDRAGTQQGGRVRIDNSNGASQKLGSLIGNKTAGAKLTSQKMLDDRSPDSLLAQRITQGKEPSKSAQNTPVDFWLSNPAPMSMQNVEEPVPVDRPRDHVLKDGRSRSTLMDSTTESSFRRSDANE